MFVTPFRYSLQIILVGGCVLTLLVIFDGTIILLSKMCTYCLLLSFVWVLEPLWTPPSKETQAELKAQQMAPLMEATVVDFENEEKSNDESVTWAQIVA